MMNSEMGVSFDINTACHIVHSDRANFWATIVHNINLFQSLKSRCCNLIELFPLFQSAIEANDAFLVDLANAIPFEQQQLHQVDIAQVQRLRVEAGLCVPAYLKEAQLRARLSPVPRHLFMELKASGKHLNYILWQRFGGAAKRLEDCRAMAAILVPENNCRHYELHDVIERLELIDHYFTHLLTYSPTPVPVMVPWPMVSQREKFIANVVHLVEAIDVLTNAGCRLSAPIHVNWHDIASKMLSGNSDQRNDHQINEVVQALVNAQKPSLTMPSHDGERLIK